MKIYKNQSRSTARELGFYANFEFASDPVMSPNGVDITPVLDKLGKYTYEITSIKDGLAKISVMSESEYKNWVRSA